ncbi:MAG: hypothetical protein HYY91_03390 [Candidatus Omnitrophica bacterium]|nr:hypothetical protein [Candidatus Omnitrophota bacterium]
MGARRRASPRSPLARYGRFSPSGDEFIVTRPETPWPWINYLTNDQYCAVISQCAGGYSFYKDCRTDRLMRWLPENYKVDRPGRYLYLRDVTKGSRLTWSATYQPMKVTPEFFEARHGIGYTIIRSRTHGIETEAGYFVPRQDPCEVWLVRVTNRSSRTRTLELFPYVEWLLGDYHLELRYRNIMNLYNRVWYEPSAKAIFAKKTAAWGDLNIQPFVGTAFFGSSLPVDGAVTVKEAFLGRLRTEESPEMLCGGAFRAVPICSGEDGIAVVRHRVTLKPRQTVAFSIVVGQTDRGEAHATQLLTRYRDLSRAREEFDAVKRLWRSRVVENIRVETPDVELNQFVSNWLKYEVTICNFWSRSPSYFHEGSGGRGYRDSCQDAESICLINPEHARQKILKLASLIRQDGTCAPGWSDTSGPATHRPNKDHPTWLVSTVAGYIKETGDVKILHEDVPYLKDRWLKGWDVDLNWKGGAVADGSGPLWEHLERNLAFTFSDVGPHGIPRIGHADWNDALDAVGLQGRGETVWLAMALVRSLKLFAELMRLIGNEDRATDALAKAGALAGRINAVAWDGGWYLYGFTDEGRPFGCKANAEGKIYLNTQSWAILAGVADAARQKTLLASVDRHLDGPHGLALFEPAYTKWDASLGRISMFSEGTKENAAVFCHAATFMIVADLMAGRGTLAHARMRAIMPNTQPDYERYKTEPFAFAEYLVGPDNPSRYGEGAFTWITGTAGWFLMAGVEWLLGARRDYEGLRIDPCLPKTWKRARIVRPFRGATYDIEILNPHGLEKGQAVVTVDGRRLADNLIRPHQDGKVHRVRVVLERPGASSNVSNFRTANLLQVVKSA